MNTTELQSYVRAQQVSLQWLPFLRAFAAELSDLTDTEGLQALMAGVGQRVADEARDYFEQAQTLPELEEGLNEFWAHTNWGWVRLKEEGGHVSIVHSAAPLAEAFGDEALSWSPALLEGFYNSVFGSLGAKETMTVRFSGQEADGLCLRFQFGL